ncbi:omd [Drosophila busckii]|uniref:Omd n=1 Tax=Drosophila busckii TaxID=30019 RepID=A0A0M5JCW4_DROBS|nr:omd [Drosophila busckii]
MLQQNILEQLKQFIDTVSSGHSNPQILTKPALIKVALGFLDELPATRDIVFDYFGILAEIGVQLYISPEMKDQKTGMPVSQLKQGGNRQQQLRAEEYESFSMVKNSLQNLVWKGPPAWCPLIANWSLELVAKLSDKYTQRRMTIAASCNYWLECNAMHALLTLINSCFRKLSNTEAESCVETMLNAFHRYPMTFDWIVARLGGCFPYKIIMQIIQCGMRRFVDNFRCHLDSEAGILDYMTSCHEPQLQAAFKEILKDGLAPKKPLDVAIVPFLLITTNYSDAILQSLVNVFVEQYTDELIDAIVQKAPLWMSNKMFMDMQPSLNNAVLRLQQHGAKLLLMVSKMSDRYIWCQDFLDTSMQELEQYVLNMRNFPLLSDLACEETKYMLWQSCLSTNIIEQQTATRLLLVVSSQHPHIYYQSISQLIRKSYAQYPSSIGALMRLLGGQRGMLNLPSITKGIKMTLEEITLQEQVSNRLPVEPGTDTEAYNTFYNLNMLVKMQKKTILPHMKPQLLLQSLNECMAKIIQILDCTIQKLVLRMDKDASERSAEKFREQQANNNNKNIHDLYNGESDIKRRKLDADSTNEERDLKRMELAHLIVELLNNIEAGTRLNVLRTPLVLKLAVLSVKYFFVGLTERSIIGRGLRPVLPINDRSCDAEKQALYLKALYACCADLEKPKNIEGYSLVSLTLVELVSTDVMYNGLPFPDEEFTRVTMERDMQIRRAFITSPVLWAVLGLIATHRPALCYSSVLLRALCATCLHHWRGKNVNKFQPTDANDELMLCTKKLLQLLTISQLIPPPLSNLHTIIEHFEPPEIAVVLRECIWNYLKDHVPSPALFHVDSNGLHWRNTSQAKVPAQYVDTLRHLMQRKLNKLGPHYHQMFIMTELHVRQPAIAIQPATVTGLPEMTAATAAKGIEIVELD